MKYLIINLFIFIFWGAWGAGEGDSLGILPSPYNGLKAVRPYQALGRDLEGEPQRGILKALQAREPKVVVKVGSGRRGMGVSVFPFVEALPIGSLFFVVDSYEGREEDYDQLLSNIVQRKVTHRVSPLRGTLREVISYLSREKVVLDLVYWEGEGKKEEIRGGLQELFPLLGPGGVVFIEDLFQGKKEREVGRGVEEFRCLHQMAWEGIDCWNTGPWIWSLTKTEGFKLRSLPVAVRVTAAPTEIHPITPLKTLPTWEEVESSVFGREAWDKNSRGWPYYGPWFQDFCMTLEELHQRRKAQVLTSKHILKELLEGKLGAESRIPHLLHRVWLTNPADPYEVPQDRLRCYLSTIHNELPADWKHYFWCLDKTKIPETVKALEETRIVEVKELKEIWSRLRGRDVFERLMDARIYALCCDVIRLNVVYLFGGVYSDFGIQFLRDPTSLLDHFDYVGAQEGFLYLNGFIAAISHHRGLNETLTFIDNLDRISLSLQDKYSQEKAPFWVGSAALTLGMERVAREGDKVLMLPKNDEKVQARNPYYRANEMASWAENKRFGQNSILEASYRPWEAYFPPNRWYQTDKAVHWVNYQERACHITASFFEHATNLTAEEVKHRRESIMQSAISVFHGLDVQPLCTIPHISHRIWFTLSDEVPEILLQNFVKSAKTLGEGWRHFFWCLDPKKIPHSVSYLNDNVPGIEIKSAREEFRKEHSRHLYGERLFSILLENQFFTLASNIFRMNLVFEYGGLYCDMGVSFRRNLTPLLDLYDVLLYRHREISSCGLDTGLFALPPRFPILQSYLEIIEDPKKMFPVLKDPNFFLGNLGVHLFEALLIKNIGSETRLLPLERTYFIENDNQASWRERSKFGNTPFSELHKREISKYFEV